jgi:hypothetical protein
VQQEAVRIVADWFQDATNGINTLLLVVPVEAGDVPDPVTVNDETRHAWVARREIPREKEIQGSPIVAVSLFDNLVCKNNPQLVAQAWQDADLVLAVRYIAANSDARKPRGTRATRCARPGARSSFSAGTRTSRRGSATR